MQLQVAVMVLTLPGPAGHGKPSWQFADISACLPLAPAATSWTSGQSQLGGLKEKQHAALLVNLPAYWLTGYLFGHIMAWVPHIGYYTYKLRGI